MKKTKMGVFLLTMIVTGTVVGSGIYMLPASLAEFGSIGLLGWVLAAAGAIFLAMVFAKMGTLYPRSGGPYAYAHAEFGNYIGFQAAYCYWIGSLVANASMVPPAIGYLSFFFPGIMHYKIIVGLSLIWLFAIINLFGTRKAGIVAAVTTICKFVPILIVVFAGWKYFDPGNITHYFNVSHKSPLIAITLAATLALWSFIGLDAATVPAGDVINPKRTIPIATMLGTLIAAVAYIITCTSIMGMVPMHKLATCQYPFAISGRIILGQFGAFLVTFGGLFSLLGTMNSWTLLESQVPMAAANDGLFLKIFAKRNRHGVPGWGLIITTIIVSILLIVCSSDSVIKQFETFILAATTMLVITYLYTALAEIKYMIKNKKEFKHYRMNIFIGIVGALFCGYAIIGAGPKILLIVVSFLLLTIPLYFLIWLQRKRKKSEQ